LTDFADSHVPLVVVPDSLQHLPAFDVLGKKYRTISRAQARDEQRARFVYLEKIDVSSETHHSRIQTDFGYFGVVTLMRERTDVRCRRGTLLNLGNKPTVRFVWGHWLGRCRVKGVEIGTTQRFTQS
jgi:hypothetical protein